MPVYNELPVPGEGTATETFSWIPSYATPIEEKFDTRKFEFEAGYEQSFPAFTKTRRSFKASFISIDETVRDAILAFIEARVGSTEAFYLTLPDETVPIKVCAIEDSVKSTKVNPDIFNVEITFLEIY